MITQLSKFLWVLSVLEKKKDAENNGFYPFTHEFRCKISDCLQPSWSPKDVFFPSFSCLKAFMLNLSYG